MVWGVENWEPLSTPGGGGSGEDDDGETVYGEGLLGERVLLQRSWTHHCRDLPLQELNCGSYEHHPKLPDLVPQPLLQVEVLPPAGQYRQVD